VYKIENLNNKRINKIMVTNDLTIKDLSVTFEKLSLL